MSDDFTIRIGTEIRDELPYAQPRLEKGRYKEWGKPEHDNVRIIFTQQAYHAVMEHARSDSHEIGGVLLGRAYLHEGIIYVEAIDTIRALNTEAGRSHVTFTPKSWSQILHEQEQRAPELKIVGWYHTHPNMGIFVSGDDIFLHKNFFKEPWQIALVVDAVRHHGGFFIWHDNELSRSSGFYEQFGKEKKSKINWKNLPTVVGIAEPASILSGSEGLTPESTSIAFPQWALITAGVVLVAVLIGLGLVIFQTRNQLAELQTAAASATETMIAAQVTQAANATATAEASANSITATADAAILQTAAVADFLATQAAQTVGVVPTNMIPTASTGVISPTPAPLTTPTVIANITPTPTAGSSEDQDISADTIFQDLQFDDAVAISQGITITLGAEDTPRILDSGAIVPLNSELQFALVLINTGTTSITLVRYGLVFTPNDAQPPISVELPTEAGQTLAPGATEDVTLQQTFTVTGTFTAEAFIWRENADGPNRVPFADTVQETSVFSIE